MSYYVANTVGEYDATTGAAINPAFIGVQGTNYFPAALALDGNNHLFVGYSGSVNRVSEFDATTGAIINPAFITGISGDLLFVSSVPEPSSLLLLGTAAVAAVGVCRRRFRPERLAANAT